MSPRFLVVVPCYNCLEFLPRCLESIEAQNYPDFRILVLDDASTDAQQREWLSRVFGRSRPQDRLQLNPTNLKMPRNLLQVQPLMQPDEEEVIVLVDGDDWLPHGEVLTTLAKYYEDPELWLTYGSYTRWPDPSWMPNPALPYPPEVIAAKTFRTHRCNRYNHPLTFRAFLWNEVRPEELQFDDGQWFMAGYDHAIMMPMLELAAGPPPHLACLPEVLYCYNEGNPISDCKIRAAACNAVHAAVNARPPRDSL